MGCDLAVGSVYAKKSYIPFPEAVIEPIVFRYLAVSKTHNSKLPKLGRSKEEWPYEV